MMDIIIVSTSNSQQEEYWQYHLTQMKPLLFKQPVHVICIAEDWAGGAGNGLGTLYAYRKACEKAKILFNLDLIEAQTQGAWIGLYHTAGKGKRLYPLTGSELGNKSAVKLPGRIPGSKKLASILETVIYQTASLSSHQKGRLSVFWGDQIFVPSNPTQTPRHHIELLCKNIPLPSCEDWVKKGYERYGFVISERNNSNLFFEKLDAQQYASLLKTLPPRGLQFELSLGCFSLSQEILKAFLDLFKEELEHKKTSLDSDIHFWMPLLLDEQTYIDHLGGKGVSLEWAKKHFNRLQSVKQSDCVTSLKPLFGTWDIGPQSHWWDYGNLNDYFISNMAILQNNSAGEFLRHLFGWEDHVNEHGSLLCNSHVTSGKVINSLLINVEAEYLDVSNCLIINSNINTLKANYNLLYEVTESDPLSMNALEVRSDIEIDHQYFKLHARLDEDGKKNWNNLLPKNNLSFSELNQKFVVTTITTEPHK